MNFEVLIKTRQGLCSLAATVFSLMVAIMYRTALRGTSATDNWTGDNGIERWTDMGMLVIGVVFGLPGAYITHSIGYFLGHRDTPADFIRLFVCGSLSLCSSAMLLAVGNLGGADQGRAIGITMGVFLLLVALTQWYHCWWTFHYLKDSRGGTDIGDVYYGGKPYGKGKVADPPATSVPLMNKPTVTAKEDA